MNVGPTRNAARQRNPTAVTPHDLDNHHAMMRSRRRVNFVDGIGHRVQRCIEAESPLRGQRSLSIVLGTPTIFMPFCESS